MPAQPPKPAHVLAMVRSASLADLYSEVELTKAWKRSELIAATMRREIVQALIDGTLREGDPLPPEKDVIDRFAAARSTVREAMRILEGHGLVEFRVGALGGAFVRLPRTDAVARHVSMLMELRGTSLEEIWELRTLLETAAVRKLALRQPQGAVARLRQVILDADRDAADTEAVSRHVLEFLDVMMSEVDNTAMQITVATVRDILEMEHRVTAAAPAEDPPDIEAWNRLAVRAMQHVVDLIEQGAADAAEAFWRQHLDALGRINTERTAAALTRGAAPRQG